MKNFLKEIKNSVYSPDFYRELLEKPFSYSLKYFAKLFLLLAFIYTSIFSAFAIPLAYKFSREAQPFVEKNFPDNLEVKIEKGIVSTNQENPYFYEKPEILKKDDSLKFKNLFVIDTREGVGLEEFKNYDTLFLLSRNSFIYQEENDQITVRTLDEKSHLVINKKIADDFVQKALPYLKFIVLFMIFAVFVFGYFFLGAFNLGYLLFGALFIWLVAHIKKINLTYQKAYQLGLHLMTLPLIIFAMPFGAFPFAFTFLLIVMVAINLEEKEEEIKLEITPENQEEDPNPKEK